MQLYMPTQVYSESNCVTNHAHQLRSLGTKAMIVTGRSSAAKTGALRDVVQALGDMPYIHFDQIEENPSVETVMLARELAVAQKVDLFIGIGGGSPMDASKAIAMMAANLEKGAEVLYVAQPLAHYPVVCVPTTCGTGSEVTPYAILTRHQHQTKKSISHKIFPALALLDPAYLKHMPRSGLISTAVDALSHLLESYLNANTNELNRIYSREGLRMWAVFKDRLLEDKLEEADLARMLHASMAGGMAITHTGTSLPHGMSYPVTYTLGIPHGRAVGMFLGGFVDSYGDPEQAKEAAHLLGFSDTKALRGYLSKLLGTPDVPKDLLETAASKLLEDPSKLKNYPFPITAEQLLGMLN